MDNPPASVALEQLGIPHTVFRHAGPVNSLEQAAAERGQRPEQVVRSILFRLGEDEYLMALVAGPDQISWKKLRKHVGQSRLTMASEEEVLSVTGYRVGAVSPFGVPRPLKVLVDQGVLREQTVSLGSGVRAVAIVMQSADLLKALADHEVVELVESGKTTDKHR
ncbi:MAG TPA: YbaK/EbsC family protein [Anaerolineales bacterium]|nr:YbaK/EbsC family protein [Anaerolineales bacterium]